VNSKLVCGFLGFASLALIYLVSLFLFYYLAIPLPPALIGIFLLLLVLIMRRSVPVSINISARPMLAYMGLFLLPALISVLLYVDLFTKHYLALIVAVGFSTVVSLGITLWFSQKILSRVKANISVVNEVQTPHSEKDE
jgi:holin-like protein